VVFEDSRQNHIHEGRRGEATHHVTQIARKHLLINEDLAEKNRKHAREKRIFLLFSFEVDVAEEVNNCEQFVGAEEIRIQDLDVKENNKLSSNNKKTVNRFGRTSFMVRRNSGDLERNKETRFWKSDDALMVGKRAATSERMIPIPLITHSLRKNNRKLKKDKPTNYHDQLIAREHRSDSPPQLEQRFR